MQHRTILSHSPIVLHFLTINSYFCVNKNQHVSCFFKLQRYIIFPK